MFSNGGVLKVNEVREHWIYRQDTVNRRPL